MPSQYQQQPGQQQQIPVQDIAVNGNMDFTDLSQFGIDTTNITFDPSVSLTSLPGVRRNCR